MPMSIGPTPKQLQTAHQSDQQKIRDTLLKKALVRSEEQEMKDLAGEIDKHLSRPNLIPLEVVSAMFIKENWDALPHEKKQMYSDWYLKNIDPYRPVEIVQSFQNPIRIMHEGNPLKLPAQFSGQYQTLKSDLKTDTIIQLFHKYAVDGAFPKHAAQATASLEAALTEAQVDPANVKRIGATVTETQAIMQTVRQYLNPKHRSYIKPGSESHTTTSTTPSAGSLDDFDFDD